VNKTTLAWIAVLVIVIAGLIMMFRLSSGPVSKSPAPTSATSTEVLQVVAAENFWGSLVQQLGGTHVQVLSIVSDPNADPHEYESNATDARAVATANYVIENGAGYDSWMDKLVNAGPGSNANRKVLNVADLLGKKEGDNPHFWYSPAYVNQTIAQMEQDLIALDPADAAYYQAQYKLLQASLVPYQARIVTIQQQFGGTKVAATEDIFAYLATAANLNLISPPAFIEAVAEGNDPPASSIVEFENQLQSGGVAVLVYNEQTVTPLTDSMKKLAAEQDIPVVGVTETIQPPDVSFEDWMNAQLIELQNALNAKTLGQ
jgi:zinc/manganese transport system substrate-binding protein